MKKFFYLFLLIFSLDNTKLNAMDNIMILQLKYGNVEIELFPDKAPNHVKRFKELANSGKYDNVVFHRVIDGFMAQTGDVKFGNTNDPNFNLSLAAQVVLIFQILKLNFQILHTQESTFSSKIF